MEHISRSLERLLGKLGLNKRVLGWSAIDIWEDVVGSHIASNATAVAYRDSKLFVQVATTTWIHELSFMKEEILGRLNRKLGRKVVEDIVFFLAR